MTMLDNFVQFYPILNYFTSFWMGTLSEMMVNFKILAEALAEMILVS